MEINNGDGKVKVIAYYLPQFYPCEFNDKWYGKGFTEWTNVAKAKPQFNGHYQPHIPADLGFYDLRLPEVVEQQVELAKEAGIFGFSYWHYWFGGGIDRMLLEMPAERMLKTKKPDFPFCFSWDNGSWYKKKWEDDKSKDVLTMEMLYPGKQDHIDHFNYCLPFFKDKRYIRYDNRPVFLIYNCKNFPNLNEFIDLWNNLAKENGLSDGIFFVGEAKTNSQYIDLNRTALDAITFTRKSRIGQDASSKMHETYDILRYKLWNNLKIKTSNITNYEKAIKYFWNDEFDSKENVVPVLFPNWDHTPRSGGRDGIFVNATPENFEKGAQIVLENACKYKSKWVYLKSWNEWGEGNYMEPDLKYGKGFITALKKVLDELH